MCWVACIPSGVAYVIGVMDDISKAEVGDRFTLYGNPKMKDVHVSHVGPDFISTSVGTFDRKTWKHVCGPWHLGHKVRPNPYELCSHPSA